MGKKKQSSTALLGLAWYKPEQWEQLRQVSEDVDNLEQTHGEWLRHIQKMERDLRRQGIDFRRVYIDVDALVAWCRAEKRPVNGEARAAYVAWLIHERHRTKG